MEENAAASDPPMLDELRRHRAELHESMGALEHALAAPAAADPSRWTRRVEAALVEIAGDFRAHVDLTEGPQGVYGDVVRTAPRLSGAVDALTREHLRIGGQVERLLAQLAGTDAGTEVEGVRSSGTALLGRLVRHRQRDSDLVFEAYEFDIGGET